MTDTTTPAQVCPQCGKTTIIGYCSTECRAHAYDGQLGRDCIRRLGQLAELGHLIEITFTPGRWTWRTATRPHVTIERTSPQEVADWLSAYEAGIAAAQVGIDAMADYFAAQENAR